MWFDSIDLICSPIKGQIGEWRDLQLKPLSLEAIAWAHLY